MLRRFISLEEVARLMERNGLRCIVLGGWEAIVHGAARSTSDVDRVCAWAAESLQTLLDALPLWAQLMRLLDLGSAETRRSSPSFRIGSKCHPAADVWRHCNQRKKRGTFREENRSSKTRDLYNESALDEGPHLLLVKLKRPSLQSSMKQHSFDAYVNDTTVGLGAPHHPGSGHVAPAEWRSLRPG